MDLRKGWEKRNKLTLAQLQHLHQQLEDELRRYRHAIRNYTAEKYRTYGVPVIDELTYKIDAIGQMIVKVNHD